MQKVRLNNGRYLVVSNNEAHSLIEAGLAKLVVPRKKASQKEVAKASNKMFKHYRNK